ncbi:MAG TPA: ABC transporter permease subunit [Mycobacteriales bacterium]|nr:ABC transporter permease subunit [Mycobacteriales bacterium]
MTWLSWRQLRTQAVAVYGLLAALAVLLLITGNDLRHLLARSGVLTCDSGDCGTVLDAFNAHYKVLRSILGPIIYIFPGILGIFWGAPLVARELESGTYRLAWTQSVSRTRWLATKVAVVGLAGLAVTGLFSLLVTWWSSPNDTVSHSRFSPPYFDERNLMPVAWAAFTFAFGVLAGVLIRRTLPAMAATLVAYIGAKIVMTAWIIPNLATPLKVTGALKAPEDGPPVVTGRRIGPSDWVVSQVLHGPDGRAVHDIRITPDDPCARTHACFDGFTQTTTFHPGSRYWPFQWESTGILVGLAAAMLAAAFLVLRRRAA